MKWNAPIFLLLAAIFPGCGKKAEKKGDSNPPGAFDIRLLDSYSTNRTPKIAWTTSVGAGSFDVVIGKDKACANSVQEATKILTTEWTPAAALDQGQYYICVISYGLGGSTAATNSGLSLEIDAWDATAVADSDSIPGRARAESAGVWTGNEILMWGGKIGTDSFSNSGAILNLTTGLWTALPLQSVLSARSGHTAVWTGTKMLIFGGIDSAGPSASGAVFEPAAAAWSAIATPDPVEFVPRSDHTAVWTGSEMLIFGGHRGAGGLPSSAKYNLETNVWTTLVASPLEGRIGHTATWTGKEMVIWGGSNARNDDLKFFGDGAAYNPATNQWRSLSKTNSPSERSHHSAVWTGSLLLVWGGVNAAGQTLATGYSYDPSTDTWKELPATNAPSVARHTAVWANSQMVLMGGIGNGKGGLQPSPPCTYRLEQNSWHCLAASDLGANVSITERVTHLAIWATDRLVVMGGSSDKDVFTPISDTWVIKP